MRAHLRGLAALLSGCTLVAPFGDLTTGDVDGGARRDGGPDLCLMRPMLPMEEPLPMGMGTEVCNRVDDDGDGLLDTDTLVVEPARGFPAIDRVLEVRGARGAGDQSVAVVYTVGDGLADELRLAELFLPPGFDPVIGTLRTGAISGFDVDRVRDGYAVAFSEAGDVRFGLARDCDLSFGERVISLASGESEHVRVAAIDPLTVLVTWAAGEGDVAAAIVELDDGMPRVGAMHPSLLAAMGLTAGHDPTAFHDGAGVGQVAFAARNSMGQEGVFLRPVGTVVGALTTVVLANAFFGAGPFADPAGAASSTGALWVALDEEAPSTSAFVTGSVVSARRYGPPASILGIAASDTVDVGVMLDFAGSPLIERVGPEVGGDFSQDTRGLMLALERWRDLVGVPRGRTRYVVVGTRGGGVLAAQHVGCF